MEVIFETLHPHRHCRLLVGCLGPTTPFRHGLGDNGEPCGHTGVGKRRRISHRRHACVYALAQTAAMTFFGASSCVGHGLLPRLQSVASQGSHRK